MPKYAARTDSNQKEIVNMYRRLGATVAPTHMVGSGFPDIVIGKYGLSDLVEIKDGSKPPSAQKLTGDEQKFHRSWGGSVRIIRTVDDVMTHVQELCNIAQILTTARVGGELLTEFTA